MDEASISDINATKYCLQGHRACIDSSSDYCYYLRLL